MIALILVILAIICAFNGAWLPGIFLLVFAKMLDD
jgi:hypothetical protein